MNNALSFTLQEYLAAPCRVSSLPYWKSISIQVPEEMRILHHSGFSPALLTEYKDEPYFRLMHDLLSVQPPRLPAGFSLSPAAIPEYAAHIAACYADEGISAVELARYTERSVYAPELWLAVREDATGQIVATGIGELDREIGEGVLEWIEVSPAFRGQGLGSFLVLELLRRMQPPARFVTVSGKCHNPTAPERLYCRCGFTGDDVWHILTKK